MSTTTIRLDDALKARLAAAAERAGTSSHAFIIDALSQALAQAEEDRAFEQTAHARWMRLLATGRTVSWDDARSHVARRSALQAAEPPAGKPVA